MKLLFTGGHHTSALAVIDALSGEVARSKPCTPCSTAVSARSEERRLKSATVENNSSELQLAPKEERGLKSATPDEHSYLPADKLSSCSPRLPRLTGVLTIRGDAVLRGGEALRGQAVKLYFVGHKYSVHGVEVESAEYREITGRGIPFYDLKAGKLYKTWNPLEWLRIPWGFFQALWILLRVGPDLIVSFGGYLAAPVVFAGWVLGIPAVTHEQTVVSGWANRFIALFAKKIFISWPQSKEFFPGKKTVLTGLPLRKEIVSLVREANPRPAVAEMGLSDTNVVAKFTSRKEEAEQALQLQKEAGQGPAATVEGGACPAATVAAPPRGANCQAVIYITGGKQGSQTVNRAVRGCLVELLENFQIIHQCGSLDKEEFMQIEDVLPRGLKARYIVQDYFPGEQIAKVYRAADLVVGRAGAHTVYELAALGKPAVLIPIPWVSHNEQEKNAQILAQTGLAKILPQSGLSAETLLESCREKASELGTAELRKAREKSRNLVTLDAAQKIAEIIHSLSVVN